LSFPPLRGKEPCLRTSVGPRAYQKPGLGLLLVFRCFPPPEEGLGEPRSLGRWASDRCKGEKETLPPLAFGSGSGTRSPPKSPCHPALHLRPQRGWWRLHAGTSLLHPTGVFSVGHRNKRNSRGSHKPERRQGMGGGDGRVFPLTQGPGIKGPER